MADVSIDITIRSQKAAQGAEQAKQALKKVEQQTDKTIKKQEKLNKQLDSLATKKTGSFQIEKDLKRLNQAMEGSDKGFLRLGARIRKFRTDMNNAVGPTGTLTAKTENLGRSIRLVDGPLGGVASRFQTLSGILKIATPGMIGFTLATAAFGATLKIVSSASRELETNLLRVEAALEVSGRSAKVSVAELESLAAQLGRDLLTNKNEALQTLASLAVRDIPGVARENFGAFSKEVITAAQGLSVFSGNLETNARKIAQAYQDPLEGLKALRRQIGPLNQLEEDRLRTLQETGRLTEAQAIVTAKLAPLSAIARKEAEGLSGAYDTLGENFTNFLTSFDKFSGTSTLVKSAILGVADALGSLEKIFERLTGSDDSVASFFDTVIGKAAELSARLNPLIPLLRALGAFSDEAAPSVPSTGSLPGVVVGPLQGPVVPEAVKEARAERQAVEDLNKALAVSVSRYEEVLLTQKANAEVAKAMKGRIFETTEAADGFAAALRKEFLEQEKGNKALKDKLKLLKAGGNEQDRQLKRLERQTQEVDLQVEKEEALNKAAKRSVEAYERVTAEYKIQEEIQRRTRGLNEEDALILERKIRSARDLGVSTAQILENQRELRKETERLYKDIEQNLSDSIEAGLRGGAKSGFDAILSYMENTFYQQVAGIFAKSVLDGLIVPASQALGSLTGTGSAGGVPGGGSSLDVLSNLSNLSSLVNIGSSALTTTVLPSGVATLVDSAGQSLFGIGQVVKGPFTGAAPFTEGVSGGLSGAFNPLNIGAGIAGSFAASKLFGEGLGTSVGSGLGGVGAGIGAAALGLGPIGAAALIFGGSLLGGGLGSLFNGKPSSKFQSVGVDVATGQEIDTGGLVGKKFSQSNQDLARSLAQTTAALTRAFGLDQSQVSVGVGSRKGIGISYSFGLTADELARGDTLSPEQRALISDNFGSAGEFFKSLTERALAETTQSFSDEIRTAIQNIDFGTAEEDLAAALGDLDFAIGFEKIFEEPVNDSLSQVEQQIEGLNTAFDAYLASARRLELSQESITRLEDRRAQLAEDYIDQFIKQRQVTTQAEQAIASINQAYDDLAAATELAELGVSKLAEVEKARARDLENLTRGFEQGVTGDILDSIDPRLSSLFREGQRYRAQVREAEALGADIRQVELLHKLRILEIEEQYGFQIEENGERVSRSASELNSLIKGYETLATSLEEALFNLRVGPNTTLTPTQKLAEAESRFLTLRDRALSGDLDAAQQLASVGNEFLSLSRAYSTITEDFVQDFNLVERTLQETKDYALSELDIQRGILDTLKQGFNDLLEELGGTSGLLGINDVVDVFTQTNQNAAGRDLGATGALGLSVGQIERTARDLLGGYTGASGSGELNSLLVQNGLKDAFDQALRDLAGFAGGGVTPTNAPFIVGENGPELMSSRTATRVTPITGDALRQIEQGNMLAARQIETLQQGFTVLSSQMEDLIAAQQQVAAANQISQLRKTPK